MQLRKWALFFFAVISVSAQTGVLKIEPSCPVLPMLGDPGTKAIKITYIPGNLLKDSSKLTLEMGLNGRYWPSNTGSIPLVRKIDGSWEGTLEPDPKHLMLYTIFQVRDDATGKIDTNNGEYWDLVFCQPTNGPHFQGVQLRADTYNGFSYENGISRKEDLGKAMSILKEYIDVPANNNNYYLLSDYWELKIKNSANQDAAWRDVSNEVRDFAIEHRADKSALVAMFTFVQLHNDYLPEDIFSSLLRYMDAIDHALAVRMERNATVNLLSSEKDSHRRSNGIEKFIQKYPQDPSALMLIAERFMLLRDFKDVPTAETFFNECVLHHPGWADAYASMAVIYTDNNQKLDRALQLLDQAERFGEDGVRPPQRSATGYVVLSPDLEQSKAAMAYWRARIYLAQNHADLALPLALKAVERQHSSERVFLVAQAYEATGEKQKAMDSYFDALSLPSTYAPDEKEKLTHLWVSGGFGTKETLEQRLRDKQDDLFRKANYTPRLIDRPVPDFEFTSLKNEKFKSADLRDRIVVLNFWGVWCIPCLPELPGFQELQQKHPEIFVAAVALSSNPDKIKTLMAKEKLDTLRIAQNDDLGDTFAPSGVPVTYVIDHGRIRVIHQDSISNVIAYIEADLAALKKEPAKTSALVLK